MFNDMSACHHSVSVFVWMILGQVWDWRQRSSCPARDARQRVATHVPRLRRLRARVLRLGVLRSRQSRSACAKRMLNAPRLEGLVRYRPFEHLSTVLILVEAELDEGADPATALGRAVDNGVLDSIAQRIYQAALVTVAQEGVKVAGRREAQTHHHRILRRVEQLVDVVRVEPALEADLLWVRDAGKGTVVQSAKAHCIFGMSSLGSC